MNTQKHNHCSLGGGSNKTLVSAVDGDVDVEVVLLVLDVQWLPSLARPQLVSVDVDV